MHQAMQGVTDKFSSQLNSFKTTRKLLTQKSNSLERDMNDLTDVERVLRRDFTWQQRLTEALLKYANVMSVALLDVSCVHEELMIAGAAEAGLEAAVLDALHNGLLEAQRLCSEVATRMQRPLDAHLAALAACGKHVREADLAAAELKHYREKLDSLKAQKQSAIKQARQSGQGDQYAAVCEHDAVKRNKAKLSDAEHELSGADARARRAMEEISSQHEGLCKIACDTFGEVCRAYRCIVKPLESMDASAAQPDFPPAERCPAAASSTSRSSKQAGGASSPRLGEESPAPSPSAQPPSMRSITPGYAAALLGSSELLRSVCDKYFKQFDSNGNGVLDVDEAMKLMEDVQESLGVPPEEWPDEEQLLDSLASYASDGSTLHRDAFPRWFAHALETAIAKLHSPSRRPAAVISGTVKAVEFGGVQNWKSLPPPAWQQIYQRFDAYKSPVSM